MSRARDSLRRGGWIVSLLLVAPLAACEAGERRSAGASGAVESAEAPAEPAPDFTLPDLQGRPVRLADQRGKVVVVDFWATWCPPCEFQVPELNKLWRAHRDRGDLEVIGVAVDVDGAQAVAPWVAEKGVDYTIVLGDEQLARSFGAMGFPTMAVVGPGGELRSLHMGLVEYDQLEELVAEAAGGPS